MSASVIQKDARVTTRNLVGVFGLRAAQIPCLALFAMLVPRALGLEVYGVFALFISLFTLSVAFVSLGVGDLFGRFVAEFASKGDWANVRKLFANVLALKLIVTLATLCVLIPVLNHFYGDRFPFGHFLILGLAILLADIENVFFALLFGLNRLVHFSAREPIRRILSLALVLLLHHIYGLTGALVAVVLVEFLLVAMAIALTRGHFSFAQCAIDLEFLRPFTGFGITVYLSWFVLTIWQRISNVLIEQMTRDSAQVALFDIGNQIFLTVFSISTIGVNSLVPIFTKMFVAGQESKMKAWSCRFVKYLTIANVVVIGSFLLIGDDAIRILIGNDFGQAFPLAVIMFFGIVPMSIAQFGFVYSVVYSRPDVYLKAVCIGVVVLLLLSLVLIPALAAMGAAIATLVSCTVTAFILMFVFREKMSSIVRAAVAAIALAIPSASLLALKGSRIDNWLLLSLFVAGYLACLFLSGRVQVGEIREIGAALRNS